MPAQGRRSARAGPERIASSVSWPRLASVHGLRGRADAPPPREVARRLPRGRGMEPRGKARKLNGCGHRGAARPANRDGARTLFVRGLGPRGGLAPPRGPAIPSSYMPLIVTLVPAPSTRITAVLGATLREPSPPFLIAPAMVTLLASAP